MVACLTILAGWVVRLRKKELRKQVRFWTLRNHSICQEELQSISRTMQTDRPQHGQFMLEKMRTFLAGVSLTSILVLAMWTARKLSEISHSLRFTKASIWDLSSLLLRQVNWLSRELHTFLTWHARPIQREISTSSIWICKCMMSRMRMPRSTSASQTASLMKLSTVVAVSLSNQSKVRADVPLSSWPIWSKMSKSSSRMVCSALESMSQRQSQTRVLCSS